jgi:hypothetical protein
LAFFLRLAFFLVAFFFAAFLFAMLSVTSFRSPS